MLIRVVHETRYGFCRPVFLEPQLVRLVPRSDAGQTLLDCALSSSPAPAGRTAITDASGNQAIRLWFEGMTEEFSLISRSTVRTLRANPFDFLLDEAALAFPLGLTPPQREALSPFLVQEGDDNVRRLSRELAALADPLAFLNSLNCWIYGHIDIAPRPEAGLQSPEKTLALGRGACRDATVLFMAACREAGIPARYVSGYQIGDPDQPERDLHAYAEAYLPGAGWRGYDPTLGLCVADGHVALCAAHRPELTAPVTGTFRGDAVSTLEHTITLEISE